MPTERAMADSSLIPSAIRREIEEAFTECATKPITSKPSWMESYSEGTISYVRYLLVARRIVTASPRPAIGSPEEWDGVSEEFFEELVQYVADSATRRADARAGEDKGIPNDANDSGQENDHDDCSTIHFRNKSSNWEDSSR